MSLSSRRGSDGPPGVTSDPCGDISSSDVHSFQCGDTVVAVRDLRVRGSVVVRQGGRGCVVGPASSSGRVCVQFESREDLSDNRLNCLPDELRHALVGGHQVGARVRAARPLEASRGRGIAPGTPGLIVGPARDPPPHCRRLLVRFAMSGEEAVEEIPCDPDDVETAIAGNFRRGNAVIATRDLRVGGAIVVREGVLGSVVGPSSSDSQHRVTVSFSHREDGSRNRLNCVVNEIRLYLAGGLEVGARVQVVRAATVGDNGALAVPAGTRGTVVGPASEEPLVKVLVRLDTLPPGFGPGERELNAEDLSLVIAGGFRRGESVTAAKDLRVKGVVVVKQGVVGTVVGQSATDPGGRVTVAFARREDGRCNNLNVVPAEIQRTPCTGGLVPGDRVAALRQLLVVPRGAYGSVLGPSCARSSRVAVRFMPVDDTEEEVVLHVEPEDLRALNAVGEDVDESGPEIADDETTEDTTRMPVAGGYDRGDTIAATRDLCVGGKVVVRQNVHGTVIGPSGQDPIGRVTVAFAWREDGKSNNLNVVTSEIRRIEPLSVARGELCAICLGELIAETGTSGEDICRMSCGHCLHSACIRAYLNHQTAGARGAAMAPAAATNSAVALAPLKPAQCPVCRRDVLP